MNTKPILLFGIVFILALSISGCKARGEGETPEISPPSAQTQISSPEASNPTTEVATPVVVPTPPDSGVITVFGSLNGEDEMRFALAVKPFEDSTGIDIVYSSATDYSTLLKLRVESGDTPDIGMLPDPAVLRDLARLGAIKPLWPQLEKIIDANFAPVWKNMGAFETRSYSVPYRVEVKSIIWYPKTAFSNAGYVAPKNWQELDTLTAKMVSEGTTPWCVGLVTGQNSGIPSTEWLEDILLHSTSIEQYDQWVSHTLPFDSTEVRGAFDTLGKIWLDPAMVYGGTSGMMSTNESNSLAMLFSNPQKCWLSRQSSAAILSLPENVKADLENQVGFFTLPPKDVSLGNPLLVSGEMFVMFNDRAEVRKFMEFLASGNSAAEWVKLGGALFPHKDLDKNLYSSTIEKSLADLIINIEAVRYGGSVSMPFEVSQSFQKGMIDFANGIDLAQILKEIDAAYNK